MHYLTAWMTIDHAVTIRMGAGEHVSLLKVISIGLYVARDVSETKYLRLVSISLYMSERHRTYVVRIPPSGPTFSKASSSLISTRRRKSNTLWLLIMERPGLQVDEIMRTDWGRYAGSICST